MRFFHAVSHFNLITQYCIVCASLSRRHMFKPIVTEFPLSFLPLSKNVHPVFTFEKLALSKNAIGKKEEIWIVDDFIIDGNNILSRRSFSLSNSVFYKCQISLTSPILLLLIIANVHYEIPHIFI